ncbi:hypothetical protein BVI1335_110052 [Burkholderia vietnamiensis]|nr:hypothetical protein BVI1335_110052 [Burkholderia vietnamiensis]
MDLGKLAGSPSDHGAGDAPNSSGDIEHARTRPSEGNPGRGGFGAEAWSRGRTPGPDGPADRAAGDSIPGVWRGGPDLAQAWRSWQPAAGCGVGPAGPDDHPGSLRRFRADAGSETAGKGVTQFGRALYELNVDAFCANSSQAQGRVERADLTTLQGRLVKELRLRGISTREAANTYAPSFIADFNRRFGKPPKCGRESGACCHRGDQS